MGLRGKSKFKLIWNKKSPSSFFGRGWCSRAAGLEAAGAAEKEVVGSVAPFVAAVGRERVGGAVAGVVVEAPVMLEAVLGVVAVHAVPGVAGATGTAASLARGSGQAAGDVLLDVATVVGPVGPGIAAAVRSRPLALPQVGDAVAAPGLDGDISVLGLVDRPEAPVLDRRVDRSGRVVGGVVEQQAESGLARVVAEDGSHLRFVEALELLDEGGDGFLGFERHVGVSREEPVALAVVVYLSHGGAFEEELHEFLVLIPRAGEVELLAVRHERAADLGLLVAVELHSFLLVADIFHSDRFHRAAAIDDTESEKKDTGGNHCISEVHHLANLLSSTAFRHPVRIPGAKIIHPIRIIGYAWLWISKKIIRHNSLLIAKRIGLGEALLFR